MNLSKLADTREWLNSWKKQGARGARMIRTTAIEQRANLEASREKWRVPTWCDINEYKVCVELLEEVAATLS